MTNGRRSTPPYAGSCLPATGERCLRAPPRLAHNPTPGAKASEWQPKSSRRVGRSPSRPGSSCSSATRSSGSSRRRRRSVSGTSSRRSSPPGTRALPEEDMVRLQWWGLYHDKPKIGTFMLRIKLPSGHLTPAKLRAIGEVSNRFGKGDGELATRQNIQLHWLELARLPEVFADLDAAGITTAGGCGDTVRNITGCPVQGLDPSELFDCSGVRRRGGELLLRQPGLLRPAAQAQVHDRRLRDHCNAPEINCVALVGVIHEGREGFAVRVGGGLSSVPRHLARPRRLRPEGRGDRDPGRDHGRLVGRPPLPRLAGEGAPEVHDRRHWARGHARARRGAARPPARGLHAAARSRRDPPTTSGSTNRSSPGSCTSARPSTSG